VGRDRPGHVAADVIPAGRCPPQSDAPRPIAPGRR
jgi:hypothetical protein